MEKNLTLTEHLAELRRVIIISAGAIVLAGLVSYFLLGDYLFNLVTAPLKELNIKLVYIGMAEALMTRLKLSFLAGAILAFPIVLWQLWSFVAPALLPHEKRFLRTILPLAVILFALGAFFAYEVVFRFAARFLLTIMPSDELQPMLSISQYVSFLISFMLPFGIVFQFPLVIYFLVKLGIVDHRFLAQKRKYAIVAIFVIAAILTPPDVVSQVLLAIPMIILYEVGVLVARLARPSAKSKESSETV